MFSFYCGFKSFQQLSKENVTIFQICFIALTTMSTAWVIEIFWSLATFFQKRYYERLAKFKASGQYDPHGEERGLKSTWIVV